MKKSRVIALVGGAAAGMVLASVAVAKPTTGASSPTAVAPTLGYCNTFGLVAPEVFVQQTFGLAVTDMTYNGNTPTANADNCYGVVAGNDQPDGLPADLWGGGFTFVAKSDEPSAGLTLNGIDFTVTEANLGTWSLTGVGAPLPAYFDFVGVLKQGNDYAAYLFDDAYFTGTAGENDGTYTLKFNVGKENPFDLSHLTVYARTGTKPEDEEPPQGRTPEPASLALVGVALLGLGLIRRRRT